MSVRRLWNAVWPPLLPLLGALATTEVAVRAEWVRSFLVPRPTNAARSLVANAGEIAACLRDTAVASVAGFVLSVTVV